MLSSLIKLIDTAIFLWLAIRGFMFIYEGGGGYINFWGCALIATAVFWKKLEKDFILDSVTGFFSHCKRE